MRALLESEMKIIVGGHDPDNPPDEITIPQVIIQGNRPRNDYDTTMWNLLMNRALYVPPDINSDDNHNICWLNTSDPFLKAAPANTDMHALRQTALMVQDYIKGQDPTVEWGAVIVRDQYGNLKVGEVTKGTPDKVYMVAQLGPGDKIVATVHSHPHRTGEDQSLPSTIASNGANNDSDEKSTLQLIANGQMDPNGLVYIIDNASNQMHEYDPKNISSTNRNNITNDLDQYGMGCYY